MKKVFFLLLATLLIVACQKKQRYTQNSPEIDTVKALLDNYNKKNYEAMAAQYSDTAKTFINSIDKGMSVADLMKYHKQNDPLYSERGFLKNDEEYEMVVTDKGDTWVNYWGEWKGTMTENGKEIHIPMHITAQFKDGKIVRGNGHWDSSPVVIALKETEDAKNTPQAEKKILASYQKFLDSWNQHDVELFKSIAIDDYKRTSNGVIEATTEAETVALMEMLFAAFPDLQFSGSDYILKDGTVHNQWIGTGTNTGEFAGNPPTGKKIKIYGYTATSYSENGELLSGTTVNDQLGMYTQLGYSAPELKK